MPADPHDPYDDPEVYDILTSPGTAAEVEGLLVMAQSTRPPHRRWRWLEPGCGTGRYLRHACDHGIDVWGYDANPRMIRYAAAHLPPALRPQLWVADFTAFAHGIEAASVDFAFNLSNSLRHLSRDDDVLAHLGDMAASLRPGGLYAVGLDLQGGDEPIREDVWTAERDGCRVGQIVQYLPPQSDRTEIVLSHLVIERNGHTEHRDHVYRLRSYDRTQWEELIAGAGWIVTDVVDEAGRSTVAAPFAYGIYLLAPVTRPRR